MAAVIAAIICSHGLHPTTSASRVVLADLPRRAAIALPLTALPLAAPAATLPLAGLPLSERLSRRQPELLTKPILNIPPGETLHPDWLEGTWSVRSTFGGYLFPSKKISRERLLQEATIPGFQVLSIAAFPDVGKTPCEYRARYARRADGMIVEDKPFNLRSAIDGGVEKRVVDRILYTPAQNPNRLSIVFLPGKARNAERIELFFNAREGERADGDTFVCSEHLRQVTFGGSSTEGVVRQVSGEYGHYTTFRRVDASTVRANVLTAVYLDSMQQDALYFQERPDQPVVIFAHNLNLTKIAEEDTSSPS